MFPARFAGVIQTQSDAVGRGRVHGGGISQPSGPQHGAKRAGAVGAAVPPAVGSTAEQRMELLNIYSRCKMAAEAEEEEEGGEEG